MGIRDRITELRRVPAGELQPDPRNWRRHPEAQAKALRAMLEDVGFADAVLARETPDGLVLIDGHLRADLAEDELVPVLVLDVDETEAGKLLATIDPLAAMAERDEDAFRELIDSMSVSDKELVTFLASGKSTNGKEEPEASETCPTCGQKLPAGASAGDG